MRTSKISASLLACVGFGLAGASFCMRACGAGALTYVWWEAEDAVRSDFPAKSWFAPRNHAERNVLSGGAWLSREPKHQGLLAAEYTIRVPRGAEYEFWARKFWKHGPFRWRFDRDDWHVCARSDMELADNVRLRRQVCANWVALGRVRLDEGEHRLRVELTEEKGPAAFDCFVLSVGPFQARGKLKPGEEPGATVSAPPPLEPKKTHRTYPKRNTYYLSAQGDDGADGSTPATAWKTLARASRAARPGDTFLLRRGDVFRGSARFRRPGLSFGAFGPEAEPCPVVAGSVVIRNWRVHRGRIYVAETTRSIEHLYVNGRLMLVARYPNEGWLRIEKGTTSDAIVDTSLARHPRNAPGYWTGANVRWRRWSWWFETRPVTEYEAAGRLELGAEGKQKISVPKMGIGSGYYLDNKIEELDAPGEWYFDADARKVYLWPPDGKNPNTQLVEGTCEKTGLNVNACRLEDVVFRHQTDTGLGITGRTIVRKCRFEGIGRRALAATWDAHDSEVTDNVFADNLNVGINWNEDPGTQSASVIARNRLYRTGMVPGYGGSGPWHASAIIVSRGSNLRVHHNRIEGAGYCGIILGCAGNTAESNFIRGAMSTLNDGGGIYTNCSRSTIRHNIILDTVGNLVSSHPWANLGQGIWPEFLADFRETVIEGNTVANSGACGIFLPNHFESVVRSNVLYNNGRAQLLLSGSATNKRTGRMVKLPYKHRIENNVFFACTAKQPTLLFRPEYDYGRMHSNFFGSPATESMIEVYGTGRRKWQRTRRTLEDWQKSFTWADKHASTGPDQRVRAVAISRLFINDTDAPCRLSIPKGAWTTLRGEPVRDSVKLEPYTSVILVLTGGGSVEHGAYTLCSAASAGQ